MPTVLLLFPEEWLPRRRDEWEPLSLAGSRAGFDVVVVSHWNAVSIQNGAVSVSDGWTRSRAGADTFDSVGVGGLRLSPDVLMTTWGVERRFRTLFHSILEITGACHQWVPIFSLFARKASLESHLRDYEARTGRTVSRPPTVISDELTQAHQEPAEELVIVKPSSGRQCRGIEIVPRSRLVQYSREAAVGARGRFVVQDLVKDQFLYHGRRWDMRVHALATSLSPLAYRLYREGVAKTAAVAAGAGSGCLEEEWLNADSYMKDRGPAESISVSEMLGYVEARYGRIEGFWESVDDVVRRVFECVAMVAEVQGYILDRAFMFAGLDLIVERTPDGHRIRLLEVNEYPGLAWPPGVSSQLLPFYTEWFEDLRSFATGARPAAHGSVAE